MSYRAGTSFWSTYEWSLEGILLCPNCRRLSTPIVLLPSLPSLWCMGFPFHRNVLTIFSHRVVSMSIFLFRFFTIHYLWHDWELLVFSLNNANIMVGCFFLTLTLNKELPKSYWQNYCFCCFVVIHPKRPENHVNTTFPHLTFCPFLY